MSGKNRTILGTEQKFGSDAHNLFTKKVNEVDLYIYIYIYIYINELIDIYKQKRNFESSLPFPNNIIKLVKTFEEDLCKFS